MISIRKNPNFSNWIQVFAFGKLKDEFNKQSKAVRYAKDLAKTNNQDRINIEGQIKSL